MKRFVVVFACFVLCAGALKVHAQVVYSATRSQRSLSVGGMGSLFQPDYAGNGIPQTSPNDLIGFGTYVDLRLSHWVQIEAEARWLRGNQYLNIYEDNYLIGPRVPIHETHRFKPYAKALFGSGKMNFQYSYAYGRFTDIALGGGVEIPLTRKISVRAFDFEYQLWPNWINGTVKPYGGSVGVSYKIF
jgi:hypothetical protein